MSASLPKTASFSSDVRKLIEERKMDYIDAVVYWCEQNNLEVEYAAGLIKRDPNIMSRIQMEAEDLNFLKKGARLPI
jgi:hypothetical protein